MTDIYTQENGSKKKFLAPLLVILLCMVSLTAAGYAYNTAISNESEPIDPEYSVLLFTDKEGAAYTAKFAAPTGYMVTTDTDLPNNLVKINSDLGSVEIFVYFMLDSSKGTQNYTVASEFKLLKDSTEVTNVTVTGAADEHKTVTFNDPTIVIRDKDDTADAPATLAKDTVYLAKITVSATADVQFANKTPVADAEAVVDAMDDIYFSLKLTATLA